MSASVCRNPYMLSLSPRITKQQARQQQARARQAIRSERLIMALAITVLCWDVVVRVGIAVGTAALLLLGLLTIAYSLVALYWLLKVLLAI